MFLLGLWKAIYIQVFVASLAVQKRNDEKQGTTRLLWLERLDLRCTRCAASAAASWAVVLVGERPSKPSSRRFVDSKSAQGAHFGGLRLGSASKAPKSIRFVAVDTFILVN